MFAGKIRFERWKTKKEPRRRAQLTPEWRFWEDVLTARDELISVETALARTMMNLDEDEELLRQWTAERHAKVEEVRLEIQAMLDELFKNVPPFG